MCWGLGQFFGVRGNVRARGCLTVGGDAPSSSPASQAVLQKMALSPLKDVHGHVLSRQLHVKREWATRQLRRNIEDGWALGAAIEGGMGFGGRY